VTSCQSDASSSEIKTGKILIITLDENSDLEAVDILDKASRRIILSKDYGLGNKLVLAHMTSRDGSFDHSFTLINEDMTLISNVYTDSEKERGKLMKQSKFHLLNFSDGEEDQVKDKMDLETEASDLYVMPAKPGFLLIAEYYRKEGKIELKLEPINF
jgi:hypothetical protein